MIISVYIDEKTEKRLHAISADIGRDIETLAENAVEEAALNYYTTQRHLKDPAS